MLHFLPVKYECTRSFYRQISKKKLKHDKHDAFSWRMLSASTKQFFMGCILVVVENLLAKNLVKYHVGNLHTELQWWHSRDACPC